MNWKFVYRLTFSIVIFGLISQSHSKLNDFFSCIDTAKLYFSSNSTFEFCKDFIRQWHRLPGSFQPKSMRITIKPYIHMVNKSDFYFQGKVFMRFQVDLPHRFVVFNAGNNLKFNYSHIEIYDEYKEKLDTSTVIYIPMKQWVLILLRNRLVTRSNYYIKIPVYRSQFLPQPNGLYLQKNGQHYSLTTLLSPFYSRNVFPCWDDPKFQSTIQFNVIRRANWSSQSIGQLNKSLTLGSSNWIKDIFTSTPPMQIYEFAFTINQFRYLENTTTNGLKIRLWFPEHYLNSNNLATKIIIDAIGYYSSYFNSSYPFKKLDVVAAFKMPKFETGSSTYGLLILMIDIISIYEGDDPSMISTATNTIRHEIAHFWIGNNFRMEWFDSLWMIEGIAGYFEEIIKFDKYGLQMSNTIDQSFMARITDDSLISHKLNKYPYNFRDVEFLFDDLIFTKGFAIIKMIHSVLGADRFQYAFRVLMCDKTKIPMSTVSLWRYFDEILLDMPYNNPRTPRLSEFMSYWEGQPGYPILNVQWDSYNNIYYFSQYGNIPRNKRMLWPIPIQIISSNQLSINGENSLLWFKSRRSRLEIRTPVNSEKAWILVNPDGAGYYRTNYDLNIWRNLIDQLLTNYSAIPGIARLQIIDDIWYFFISREMSDSSLIFRLFDYCHKDLDPNVWKVASRILNNFAQIAQNTKFITQVNRVFSTLVDPIYSKVNWNASLPLPSSERIQNRDILAIIYACTYDHKKCLYQTKFFFQQWLKHNKLLTFNSFFPLVICYGVKQSPYAIWQSIFNKFTNNQYSSSDSYSILKGLSCTRNASQIQQFISLMQNFSTTNNDNLNYWSYYLINSLSYNAESLSVFVKLFCVPRRKINFDSLFEYASVVYYLSNQHLPKQCDDVIKQLDKIRMKKEGGENLEMERAFQNLNYRRVLYDYYWKDFKEWTISRL